MLVSSRLRAVLQKAITLFVSFTTILWSVGSVFLLLPVNSVEAAAVTGVTLVDNDTTGYGIDGRDFTVSWTPGTQPAGYTGTRIFIVPNALSVDVNSITTTACGGNPCQDVGFFGQYAQNSFTLPQFRSTDSAGTNWSGSTAYKACILTMASSNTLDCSATPMTPVSDSPADTAAPFIDHSPVHFAVASTNAYIHAGISDNQTTSTQFVTTSLNGITGAGPYFKLFYGTNVASSATELNGAQLSGQLFRFTIPGASVPAAGNTLQYYLVAKDAAGNTAFFCANPGATSASACNSAPFIINTAAAGSRTVSGTISFNASGSTSPLVNAYIFAGGSAVTTVTSAANGTYTLVGLPNNDAFDFTAYKQGYCKNIVTNTIGTSDKTGVNINLNQGECGFSGGGGPGGGGAPNVIFSGPPDGSFGAPLDQPIRVGLNQTMNQATINDADAANTGDNVYLTTDDGTTKIAGSVTYCPNNSAPGCSALFAMDNNVILFTPTSSLTANTFYTLVITEGVTNQAGQSIQGNRAGGGHKISFTAGGSGFNQSQVTANFGQGGQFLPPYVKSMVPGPGVQAATTTQILLEFSDRLNTSTLTPANIQLWNISASPNTQVSISASNISADSTAQRFVTVNPGTLSAATYEVRVLGAVAASNGMTLRSPDQASSVAFRSSFTVSSSVSAPVPTIYPATASGSTGVAVNIGTFNFGFSDPLLYNTVTTSNITLQRGSTAVATSISYDPGSNTVWVIPSSVLLPNTTYTITFGTSVQSLAGTALSSSQVYTYTTGAADTVAPSVKEARCDDYTCTVSFTEPMDHDTQVDSNYAGSVLKPANLTLTAGGSSVTLTGKTFSWDGTKNALTIKGLAGVTIGSNFTLTVGSAVTDLSNNAINGSANSWSGKIEDSRQTFGSFGGGMGMFGPPTSGGGTMGGEFKPQGFGTFTAQQFALGQADEAFAYNSTAGQDSNVFHISFHPGIVLQNGDQIILTFPTGTGVGNAAPDTYSPFKNDINQSGGGTVTFDNTFNSNGVSGDATSNKVTVQLAISGGTPGANDSYTIDLKKIVNPAIPKGFNSSGYTVDMKVSRAGQVLASKTSMPYFINPGGSRSITVNIYAGSQSSPVSGANGSVFLFGGGPAGPINKNVTLTNGIIAAVDGASASSVQLSSLNDGCYFFGTDPFVTLGGSDYFGQMSPEPVCVNSSTPSVTKNIVLGSSSGSASVPVVVKLSGISNFGGVDVDIFAGGPGRFVVKTLSALTTPDSNGYTIRLPANGNWFVGVGPSMPKSASATTVQQLPGVPPPPVNLSVSGVGGGTSSVTLGGVLPPGATFDSATSTLTFTFATANKPVTGQVTDGTTALSSIQVFVHAQGFGIPTMTTTDASGNFTLNVSDYGNYQIGASSDGIVPVFQSIDVESDGNYYKGKLVSGTNPLVLKLKKGSYTISGKVVDSSSNAIAYAPVFATDSNGNSVPGGTDSNGNYTLFVDAGTWTVQAQLPPDKTDTCGTFSKTVTVTNDNQSNQTITPSTSTCVDLSGTITVGGSALANAPVFIDEWDATNSRPVAGGFFKGTSTNSSGVYTAKVAGNKTYRIGTFSPTAGQLSTTQAVTNSNISNANITATTGTITFSFTGGTSTMSAFVNVKNASDSTIQRGQQKTGLDTNLSLTVPATGTYNYFVDVPGYGKFTGTVATGATATINVSGSSFLTLSGNVKDANTNSANNLKGALVTATDTSTGLVNSTTTDSSGNYTLNLKAATYKIAASLNRHVPSQAPSTIAISSNTVNYNFGGANGTQGALVSGGNVITGTIYQSDGSTPMTSGYVSATNSSTAVTITAVIDSQSGTYSLPVTNGTWTISAKGPRHAKTTRSGTVTIAGADSSGNNITLSADTTRASTTESKSLAADVGGSIDDTDSSGSGVKLTAGSGVLDTGSGDVTVNVQKTFTAPDTSSLAPLGDATFQITATGSSGTITDLKGTADLQINYSSLVSNLPASVSESSLKLVYYSPEKGSYVPVEGGFTLDTTNHIATAQTTHFTDFAIVYLPATPTPTPTPGGGGAVVLYGAGLGGGGAANTTPSATPTPTVTPMPTGTPVASPTPSVPAIPISQMTIPQLQAMVAQIQTQIRQLMAELELQQKAATVIPTNFKFTKGLRMGQRSLEVKYLQIFLKTMGPDIYPEGVVNGNFGRATRSAVIRFQQRYASQILGPAGLLKGNGMVGNATRAKLNDLLGR